VEWQAEACCQGLHSDACRTIGDRMPDQNWASKFDEPIELPDGRKLRTLKEAIAWLAKIQPFGILQPNSCRSNDARRSPPTKPSRAATAPAKGFAIRRSPPTSPMPSAAPARPAQPSRRLCRRHSRFCATAIASSSKSVDFSTQYAPLDASGPGSCSSLGLRLQPRAKSMALTLTRPGLLTMPT
jgi:hypothetical protein